MILVVNIRNTEISIGVFCKESDSPKMSFTVACDHLRTTDEYASIIRGIFKAKDDSGLLPEGITGAVISSVVPNMTRKIRTVIAELVGREPMIVGPGVKTGFHIRIDNPAELGGDIVANVSAIIDEVRGGRGGKAAIIADISDINTISAVNAKGEFIGCCIFPGVSLSFEALHGKGSQLPIVEMTSISSPIGKNSHDALCSGVILGSTIAIDGFVERFAREMELSTDMISLVATGRDAQYILAKSRYNFEVVDDLTLRGLKKIYIRTARGQA